MFYYEYRKHKLLQLLTVPLFTQLYVLSKILYTFCYTILNIRLVQNLYNWLTFGK